ncbi:MAG: hypothetical protein K5978_08445 [Campylobacter sp.]|nr:hypothetical protein [Campylobacter sp.]
MSDMIKDKFFGQMQYKHGWVKKDALDIFGKKNNILIKASSFKMQDITSKQQESYEYFVKNLADISARASLAIYAYIKDNFDTIKEGYKDITQINTLAELNKISVLKEVLFKQDGEILLLLEVVWDEENGLGVKISPDDCIVGPQDVFL